MKIRTRFTAEAEAAAERYGILVEAWRSLFQQALNAADFGSGRMFSRAEDQAYAIARSYLETESATIARVSAEIASDAHQTTLRSLSVETAQELPDDALEHLADAESYLKHELLIQIERDIAFLRQSLRKTVLQINTAARAQRISTRTAMMHYRVSNVAELHFFFHDRGNQKWPSRKFVRAVWRHHLVSLYNEVVLMTLAEHGVDIAEVVHSDPKSSSHGLQIAMSSNSALPTYAEIRNEVFHPNSEAILQKVGG